MSERLLRTIALGRKNFLFVGNKKAERNLAMLQSIVATCEANGIHPQSLPDRCFDSNQNTSLRRHRRLTPSKLSICTKINLLSYQHTGFCKDVTARPVTLICHLGISVLFFFKLEYTQ
ncbi:MAG TPA: hypothetical protein DCE42_16795 [Myxococcales bacterium]|nr:hypothetical protein [Myxococcales bacterium]